MLRFMLALSMAGIAPMSATELVSLSNGFQLEADAHRLVGRSLVLEQAGGTIEVEADQVVSIETLAPPAVQHDEKNAIGLQAAVGPDPIQLISEASLAEGLPANFVLSVAHVESGFQVNARSAKGAVGLMQLMPQTAAELGVLPDRAEENANGGARYLRQLLIRYKGDSRLALAAYNAGPRAVDRFRDVPPYLETQQYVERVLREFARREAASQAKTAPTKVAQLKAKHSISSSGPASSSSASRLSTTTP
ncbi:MAG: lytic transglycosylase domain-containing protein [Bryobacteraceae bacterium]